MKLTTISALFLGLIIGVCATMALHVDRPGPDAGDWLGFAGALVGVVFTIAGTLWLEHYRASSGAREDRNILLATLREINVKLIAAAANPGAGPIADERASRIATEESLLRSLNKFVYARHYVPKRNLEAWQSIEELNDAICRDRPLVEKEIRLLVDAGDNLAVLNVNIGIMDDILARVQPLLLSSLRLVEAHAI